MLERDLTQDLKDSHLTTRDVMSGCLGGIAMLAALGVAIYGLAAYGPDFVRAHFPRLHSHAEMPVALVGFAVAVLMCFFAARKSAKQAATWPSVRGKIVNSGIEEYQERYDDEGRTRWRTECRPAVESTPCTASNITTTSYGMTVSAGKGYAEKVAAKYPVGGEVDVHYDPAAPATLALELLGARPGSSWRSPLSSSCSPPRCSACSVSVGGS